MASNSYWKSKNNTFSLDDEVDDETFLKHSAAGPTGYMLPNSERYGNGECDSRDPLEDKRQQLLQKKKEIEQRSLQSTQRSLSYLRNSEEVGLATAEELLKQREQLERTEKSLDDIKTTLRFSQKHIQGIKSVFGSVKNLLVGKSDRNVPITSSTSSKTSVRNLYENSDMFKSKEESVHPGLRTRGITDYVDSRDDSEECVEFKKAMDQNLDEMLISVNRLKGLAQGLGSEIESQNDIIDNLKDKTEWADATINKQNKEINRFLK